MVQKLAGLLNLRKTTLPGGFFVIVANNNSIRSKPQDQQPHGKVMIHVLKERQKIL